VKKIKFPKVFLSYSASIILATIICIPTNLLSFHVFKTIISNIGKENHTVDTKIYIVFWGLLLFLTTLELFIFLPFLVIGIATKYTTSSMAVVTNGRVIVFAQNGIRIRCYSIYLCEIQSFSFSDHHTVLNLSNNNGIFLSNKIEGLEDFLNCQEY
jgi:hypothetical protein